MVTYSTRHSGSAAASQIKGVCSSPAFGYQAWWHDWKTRGEEFSAARSSDGGLTGAFIFSESSSGAISAGRGRS